MVYKQIKLKQDTDDLLNECIDEYLSHHPEMNEMFISRNKIIYEIAMHYMRSP